MLVVFISLIVNGVINCSLMIRKQKYWLTTYRSSAYLTWSTIHHLSSISSYKDERTLPFSEQKWPYEGTSSSAFGKVTSAIASPDALPRYHACTIAGTEVTQGMVIADPCQQFFRNGFMTRYFCTAPLGSPRLSWDLRRQLLQSAHQFVREDLKMYGCIPPPPNQCSNQQ